MQHQLKVKGMVPMGSKVSVNMFREELKWVLGSIRLSLPMTWFALSFIIAKMVIKMVHNS